MTRKEILERHLTAGEFEALNYECGEASLSLTQEVMEWKDVRDCLLSAFCLKDSLMGASFWIKISDRLEGVEL